MNCPVYKTERRLMAECQGIEIDDCPKCRGVLLDGGELDKIIERSFAQSDGTRSATPTENHALGSLDRRHCDRQYKSGHRKSLCKELFD